MKSKIVAEGKFYPEDISLEFADFSNRKIDFETENKIDEYWKKYAKVKKESGGMIWDAVTYRLEGLSQCDNKIDISLGEINFSKRIGAREYLNELSVLGRDYYPAGIYLASIIKTNDEYYVMGELSGKTVVESDISLIGGVLSRDEMIIKNSVDIFEMLQRELDEEIYIKNSEISDIYLRAITQTERLNFGFIFCVNLNIDAKDIQDRFVPNDEIAGVRFCSKKEIKNILRSMGGARALVGELI
ncbi:MAG: hypothetical protein WAV16_02635 [Candidatus Moraniibacteriota bacterium]